MPKNLQSKVLHFLFLIIYRQLKIKTFIQFVEKLCYLKYTVLNSTKNILPLEVKTGKKRGTKGGGGISKAKKGVCVLCI